MKRLVVHVEGPTEFAFVRELLAPHLLSCGYYAVWPRLVGNAQLARRTGGIKGWLAVRQDIIHHLRENRGCRATLMVDYYGLPQSGEKAWPGRAAAEKMPWPLGAKHLAQRLLDDVQTRIEGEVRRQFLPFVTMHEFEGLLFSDCPSFARAILQPDLLPALQLIRDSFGSPEAINDSPATAPSKRIEALVAGYSKPVQGMRAARTIGLAVMRRECTYFDAWLTELEQWLRD